MYDQTDTRQGNYVIINGRRIPVSGRTRGADLIREAGDAQGRRVVKVGVAYGSPVRKVAELLLDCMRRHGQVLKEPEPRVLFDDFGESALVFAMYFWLEMRPGVASSVVMSDLRFMVQKALDEAGISMPFPQRDVHLDAARPLQVELTRGRPAAG